jgi:hypothetical protein
MNLNISELRGKTVGVDFMNQFIRLYRYCDVYDPDFSSRDESWLKGMNAFVNHFEENGIELVFVVDDYNSVPQSSFVNETNLSCKQRKQLNIPKSLLETFLKPHKFVIVKNADSYLENSTFDFVLTNDKGIKGPKIKINESLKIVGSEVSQNYVMFY